MCFLLAEGFTVDICGSYEAFISRYNRPTLMRMPYAIITLEDVSNYISTRPFAVISINAKDKGCNVLNLLNPRSSFGREVLVIGASVNTKDFAQGFDAVLELEFIDSI